MTRLVAVVMLTTLAVAGSPAHGATDAAATCKEAKAKVAGKKAFDLVKAFGKNLKKPDAAKLDADVSKALSKFAKGFSKAESKGGCRTSGDWEAIEAKVDAFVAVVTNAIDGPLDYSGDDTWLCKPGMVDNQCFVNSLDSTKVLPDTSTEIETHTGSEEHDYDCFYVYPTVDLFGPIGNHTDFSDISLELDPLRSHVARFNYSCRIFAPLYRQITLGTFGTPEADQYLEIAYRDVEAAWQEYMDNHNEGRNFVIMGHSQGTYMTTRLVQERIDPSPELRARLIAALLIGGRVLVPEGEAVGGSFQNIPLCTSAEETGCVIAFRTYAEGYAPTNHSNATNEEGMDQACTNPAALGGGEAYFSRAYFLNVPNQALFRVSPNPGYSTPFSLYEDFYAGECIKDADNASYLEIRIRPGPGDLRTNRIRFSHPALAPSFLGTHILDWSFPLGDLIDLVETKAAQM